MAVLVCKLGFVCRYSAHVRGSWTGAESTVWASESTLVCQASSGGLRSMRLEVTVGARLGSTCACVSYDVGVSSAVMARNVGETGSISVTVSGAGFGMSRWVLSIDVLCSLLYRCHNHDDGLERGG